MSSPLVCLLHLLPPEMAHDLAILGLKSGCVPGRKTVIHPILKTSLWGMDFPNPIGLAAGFDKNACCIKPLLAQGFGFIEVGTVTPLAQIGNPKPRLFRLTEDQAIINRMGFNNNGINQFIKRLSQEYNGIVGANIGKNKTSTDPIHDYVTGLQCVYGLSDYITVNISSPNTPGLRALQAREALDALLSALLAERETLATIHHKKIPLLVKIAPDNTLDELEAIAELSLKHQLDGLIVSNTTIEGKEALISPHKSQVGGLSGKPLFTPSTTVLKETYRLTEGKIPLIGVGGITSGKDAYAKIRAGASLLQIYSAVIYHGFDVVGRIADELASLLIHDGFRHLNEAVGVDCS